MLLYATTDLLVRALEDASADGLKLPPEVERALRGVKVALKMTDDQLALAQERGESEGGPVPVLGPGTIAAAREFVEHHIMDGSGVLCPVCGQNCKLYPRKFYADMAAWLIWLVKAFEQEQRWYSVNEGPKFQHRAGGGDYGKLTHWKLVERAPNDNPNKRTSGMWRPTIEGVQFVMGRLTVPSHVYLYNNEVKGFSNEKVDIRQVLGEQFSYAELMQGIGLGGQT